MDYRLGPSSEDREAWLEFRRTRITATDVAKLAASGVKGWRSLRDEKAAGESKFKGNKFTKHGSERETRISDQLDVMLGMKHNTNVLVHPAFENLVATPDLLDEERNRIGDIKTALWKGEKWTVVPRDYEDQLQWQMFVTGADGAVLAVEYHEDFVPVFMDPHLFYVKRDEERIEYLRGLAERFARFDETTHIDELLRERERLIATADEVKDRIAEVEARINAEAEGRKFFKYVSRVGAVNLIRPAAGKQFDKEAALAKIAADRGLEGTKAELKAIEEEFQKLKAAPKARLQYTYAEVDE